MMKEWNEKFERNRREMEVIKAALEVIQGTRSLAVRNSNCVSGGSYNEFNEIEVIFTFKYYVYNL